MTVRLSLFPRISAFKSSRASLLHRPEPSTESQSGSLILPSLGNHRLSHGGRHYIPQGLNHVSVSHKWNGFEISPDKYESFFAPPALSRETVWRWKKIKWDGRNDLDEAAVPTPYNQQFYYILHSAEVWGVTFCSVVFSFLLSRLGE